MPDDQRVLVTDRETGAQRYIPQTTFDPAQHELAPEQVATVAPLGGDEFAVGQEVTERAVAGGLIEGVSPEARAELTREQVAADVFDSTSNTVEQGLRGLGAGATLGVSEMLLRPDDPFARERERRERSVASGAFSAGELAGAILPGLVSGGAGSLGTLARLSPAGRLSAHTARIAARGSGVAQRVGFSAAAGAVEGAAQGVAQHLAREALNENPELSAEALASSAVVSGLVGAAAGGALPVFGAGLRRLRKRRPQPVAEAIEAPDALAALERPQLADAVGFDVLVSESVQRKTGDALGDLLAHVDDVSARASAAKTDDIPALLSQADDLGLDPALRAELSDALAVASDDLARASRQARDWGARTTAELGVDNLAKLTPEVAAKQLPDVLDDLGADVLADLDDATARMDTIKSAVQNSLAEAAGEANAVAAAGDPAAVLPASDRAPGIAQRIRDAITGRAGGVTDIAGSALGAAELARDVGVDVPTIRDVPGVGGAIALWARWKAGANALRKVGVLPASSSTRAAASVNDTRRRLQGFAARAGHGVARASLSPLGKQIARRSPSVVAREIARIRATSSATVAADASDAVGQMAPQAAAAAAAAAARAHEYLRSQAPANPLAGTIAEDDWRPTPVELLEWETTARAVRDPIAAIESSLVDPFPDRALDAVKAVYPAMFAEARQRLQLESERLRRNLPHGRLQAMGRVFELPLTISQQPGYRASFVAPPRLGALVVAAARASTPRASTASPLGSLEQTADSRRSSGLS